MKKILIIDTKAGNLFSLRAAIERLGYQVNILQKPDDQEFDGIIIPGQGRFGTVMKNICENQWDKFLNDCKDTAIPILGICVGMQIFFESSDEDPSIAGLGWLQGKVAKLNFPKMPMVGWASLESQLFDNKTVYFVNSYAVKESNQSIATVNYGETFCAAVQFKNFTGVQFHPEKSAESGSEIIKQILSNSRVGVKL